MREQGRSLKSFVAREGEGTTDRVGLFKTLPRTLADVAQCTEYQPVN